MFVCEHDNLVLPQGHLSATANLTFRASAGRLHACYLVECVEIIADW